MRHICRPPPVPEFRPADRHPVSCRHPDGGGRPDGGGAGHRIDRPAAVVVGAGLPSRAMALHGRPSGLCRLSDTLCGGHGPVPALSGPDARPLVKAFPSPPFCADGYRCRNARGPWGLSGRGGFPAIFPVVISRISPTCGTAAKDNRTGPKVCHITGMSHCRTLVDIGHDAH